MDEMRFEDVLRLAEHMHKSGLFGTTSVHQAVSMMAIALAEGQHPAVGVRDYNVINSRIAMKADAMLARYLKSGGKVEWHAYTDEEACATFSHPAGGSVKVTWTIPMARAAGLMDKRGAWGKFNRAMLRARCISEGIRTTNPAVAVGIYTPEEVETFDDPPPLPDESKQRRAKEPVAPSRQETPQPLPPYSEDRFAENKPKWQALIASGGKSAEDIIATLSTKASLSQQQIEDILALQRKPEPAAEAAPEETPNE